MKQTNVFKMYENTVAKYSGDAAVGDTGALTNTANAVEGLMLNNNTVSGITAYGAASVNTVEMFPGENVTNSTTDVISNNTATDRSYNMV